MVIKSEDDVAKFFEQKLKKSGYLLENLVEQKIRPMFDARFERQVPYVDKDESKGRANDFVVSAFIPDGKRLNRGEKKAVVTLELIIECKSLPDHGWIFFPGKNKGLAFTDFVSAMQSRSKEDPVFKTIPVLSFPSLFYASGYAEFFLKDEQDSKRYRSNNKNSNLYESVLTVTKATRHQIEYAQSTLKIIYSRFEKIPIVPVVTVFQPLIVFDGRMYSSNLVDDQPKLSPIEYAQMPKNYASKFYNEHMGHIHIVHLKALDQYLKILHDYYWSESRYILDNQQKLLRLTENNIGL